MANIQQQTEQQAGKVAAGLKDAVSDFTNKGEIDSLVSFLQPVGDYTASALRTTADYARRHPVRITITLATIGFVAARMMRSRNVEV